MYTCQSSWNSICGRDLMSGKLDLDKGDFKIIGIYFPNPIELISDDSKCLGHKEQKVAK